MKGKLAYESMQTIKPKESEKNRLSYKERREDT